MGLDTVEIEWIREAEIKAGSIMNLTASDLNKKGTTRRADNYEALVFFWACSGLDVYLKIIAPDLRR